MTKVVDYVWGSCRNEPNATREHLYAITAYGRYWPMCGYGWNRSNGHRISILRNFGSVRGECRLCQKNLEANKRPLHKGWEHKTRWI